jgi:hypothetical protein
MQTRSKALIGMSLSAALAAGGLGFAAARAQEGGEPKPKDAAPAPAAPKAPAPAEDPAALVKALGDADYDVRTKAYDRLREAGASARPALEEGAKSQDPQVRWAANRLLRALDGAPRRGRRLEFEEERKDDAPAPAAGKDEREDGDADRDVDFGFRFSFDDEAFRRSMEEMGRRMKDLERRLRDLPAPDFGRMFRIETGAPSFHSERRVIVDRDGERIDLRVAGDGKVSVKIAKKDADGKPVVESIEAGSLEALEKEHPGIHAKVKDLVGSLQAWGRPHGSARGDEALREPGAVKPVLGVLVSDVPGVLRTQLSIGDGEGMVVEQVTDGSLAARLGLRRHDVILSVNGTPVAEAGALREAAAKVKEGEEIRLRVLRGGKVEEISGKR